jgi:hypothetical protein
MSVYDAKRTKTEFFGRADPVFSQITDYLAGAVPNNRHDLDLL